MNKNYTVQGTMQKIEEDCKEMKALGMLLIMKAVHGLPHGSENGIRFHT